MRGNVTMTPLPLEHLIQERKEKVIVSLSDSFAKNKLPLEEYERLAEYISKTESERELIVVEKIVAEYSDANSTKANGTKSDGMKSDSSSTSGTLNILSSRTYHGAVKSGAIYASILGDGNIRIQKADLKAEKTVLNIVSILGSNVISVEPGIKVKNNAMALLGSAEINRKVTKEEQDGWPELIIQGATILGSIEVKLLKE
jgi:hypothetical protein